MLYFIALGLFVLAAVTGFYLAVNHFRGEQLNVGPVIAHGIFAASGLVVLIVGGIRSGLSGMVLYALILFVVAALGGFVLLTYDLRDRALPTPVVVVHGLLALTAFLLLLIGVTV